MDIKKVGIVGAGQMGGGIAEVAISSGFSVVMRDVTKEFVEKGRIESWECISSTRLR